MKTQADHARAYRKRKAAKLQRLAVYEAALREIILVCEEAAYASSCCAVGCGPVKAVNETHDIARQAFAADRFELENGA